MIYQFMSSSNSSYKAKHVLCDDLMGFAFACRETVSFISIILARRLAAGHFPTL